MPLDSSSRLVNYAKACGGFMAAVALAFSLYTTYRKPPEDVAKTSYQLLSQAVEKLSQDIRNNYDDQKRIASQVAILDAKIDILCQRPGYTHLVPSKSAFPPPVKRTPPVVRRMPTMVEVEQKKF